jgi:ferredoxin-NADP reductase
MRKGIWQEFDGYSEIVAEIEASRKYNPPHTMEHAQVAPYIERLHPSRLRLRVADVIDETSTTKTFRLVSPSGYLPPFLAGQYIALFLTVGNITTSRPYSISSPPNQIGHWDITVRRVDDGLVSNYLLDNVKPGDAIETSGPEGHFYYNPLFHHPVQVFLAGGSGITPFMSMIREIVGCGLDRTVHLFFGNRSTDDMLFHDRLTEMAERHPNINYHPVIENPKPDEKCLTGLMTGALLRDTLGGFDDKTFYVCGPQAMYDFCLGEIQALGIRQNHVRREVYGAPLGITDYPGWPSNIKADDAFQVKVGDKTIAARAETPLLRTLEEAGITPPSLCRSGECSLCRMRVTKGQVFQPAGARVRKSDRELGYVHACVSYPIGDLEIAL